MAGRVVVLEFPNADLAGAFLHSEAALEADGAKAVAMYALPTKFCECPDKRKQDGRNWRRGRKTGWQLHIDCGLPSWFHNKGLIDRMSHIFGNNLLGS